MLIAPREVNRILTLTYQTQQSSQTGSVGASPMRFIRYLVNVALIGTIVLIAARIADLF